MQNKDIISINSGNGPRMDPQTARDDERGLLGPKHERNLGRAPKKSKKRKTYEEYLHLCKDGVPSRKRNFEEHKKWKEERELKQRVVERTQRLQNNPALSNLLAKYQRWSVG